MTQPAVSRQIAGVERKTGVRLFTRAARGVRPTAAGEAAVALARECLARLQELESRLASFADLTSGELRLAGFPSVNTVLVPEAIRRFASSYPGVSFSLLAAPPEPLVAVRDGQVDLALVTDWHLYSDPQAARSPERDTEAPRIAVEGVDLVELLHEQLYVAVPAGHPLARRRRIHLTDLRNETWIDGAHPDCLGPLAPLTRALGSEPNVGFWCHDWNGKQALVAAGAGIVLVPTLAQPAMRRDTVVRRTVPALPPRILYAAVAPAHLRAPAVTAMLGILADLIAATSQPP